MRSAALRLLLAGIAIFVVLGAGRVPEDSIAAAIRSPREVPQVSTVTGKTEFSQNLPLETSYIPLPRERYGFVATSANWRQKFDVAQLGGGWYVDADPPACATSPGGMDRALIIRVRNWQSSPRWEWLESMVHAHPGSLWLVGNEPDCIWQDNLRPEDYATIYHDIYWAIKDWDSTALVSPGGIVQPTPLRLAWLERVLESYAGQYQGSSMPVDVWNIHNQILQEVRDSWGADIPPGFDWIDVGEVPDIQDNDDVEIFKQQIRDFRNWMADQGYGGWPLIISEFGVLMPVEFGFDVDRVNAFMDASFEFLRTATSATGYLADGYRLVQRWAWFSLDNPPYDPDIPMTFNGNLFDPYTTDITVYGLNFATHTEPLSELDYIDLRPGGLRFEPLGPVVVGELVTRRVEVEVRNLGSLGSGPFGVKLAYVGPTSDELQQTVSLTAGSSTWLVFNLAQLQVGAYELTVSVDANDDVVETTECDNMLETTMVVPSDLAYLPLIARSH
jgi:hypothetical protein